MRTCRPVLHHTAMSNFAARVRVSWSERMMWSCATGSHKRGSSFADTPLYREKYLRNYCSPKRNSENKKKIIVEILLLAIMLMVERWSKKKAHLFSWLSCHFMGVTPPQIPTTKSDFRQRTLGRNWTPKYWVVSFPCIAIVVSFSEDEDRALGIHKLLIQSQLCSPLLDFEIRAHQYLSRYKLSILTKIVFTLSTIQNKWFESQFLDTSFPFRVSSVFPFSRLQGKGSSAPCIWD